MVGNINDIHHESAFAEMHFKVPPSFASTEEAKHTFDYGYCLFRHSQTTMQTCEAATTAGRITHFQILASDFTTTLQAFKYFKGSHLTLKEDIAAAVLHLHLLYIFTSLYTPSNPLKMKRQCVSRCSLSVLRSSLLPYRTRIIYSNRHPSASTQESLSLCIVWLTYVLIPPFVDKPSLSCARRLAKRIFGTVCWSQELLREF